VFQRPTPFPGTVADNLAVAHPTAGAAELTTARDLATQGITLIWVTHDAAQAHRVADRIYHLRDGHLITAPTKEARP